MIITSSSQNHYKLIHNKFIRRCQEIKLEKKNEQNHVTLFDFHLPLRHQGDYFLK